MPTLKDVSIDLSLHYKNLTSLQPKKIFQYLTRTSDYGLFFPKDKIIELTTFVDADYGRCLDTKRPIFKVVIKLRDAVID